MKTTRILGLDPGLVNTGWGVIEKQGNRLRFLAAGTVRPNTKDDLAQRLSAIYGAIDDVIEKYRPDCASVEEVFVNENQRSTLKLGQARGAAMLAAAMRGLQVYEYTPNQIKKSVVGVGHADKAQIALMVKMLLGNGGESSDANDALAAAICLAHHK
ncbi:MAG: crossover junction endodeoxyribonuclease RuvC [Alphaproteobacteria bacterium]|nr:crossover junction endodeoxyribonuclease RuvC [Alphaproteobacteria bacterium]